MVCNISIKDRVTRIGFGLLIAAAVLLNWSQTALLFIAAIMVIEGIIGWCGMAVVVDKWQQKGK